MSVNVQIDNESKELPIKEIIKLPTFIELNQPLDTAYLDDIVVDLSLYYIVEEEVKLLNIDGIIYIELYNDDNENPLYYTHATFKKGKLLLSIPNDLAISEYTLSAIYAGNKYFMDTSYKSALSASNVKVVKELPHNELYLEILPA